MKGICAGYSERYPIRISIGYRGNPFLAILEEDRIPPIDFLVVLSIVQGKEGIGRSFRYTVLIMLIISFLFYTKWNTLYNTFMEDLTEYGVPPIYPMYTL